MHHTLAASLKVPRYIALARNGVLARNSVLALNTVLANTVFQRQSTDLPFVARKASF